MCVCSLSIKSSHLRKKRNIFCCCVSLPIYAISMPLIALIQAHLAALIINCNTSIFCKVFYFHAGQNPKPTSYEIELFMRKPICGEREKNYQKLFNTRFHVFREILNAIKFLLSPSRRKRRTKEFESE
jgi:hypothetical protein